MNILDYLRFDSINSACWETFHAFVVVCWLFLKLEFFKKCFQELSVSNSLDGDQDMFYPSWSGSKQFEKVNRRQQSQLTRKELIYEPRHEISNNVVYVRPAKAQTSLRICAVWSEPLLIAWPFYEC